MDQILRHHGEKLALGSALAISIIIVASGFFQSDSDARLNAVEASRSKIEQRRAAGAAMLLPPPSPLIAMEQEWRALDVASFELPPSVHPRAKLRIIREKGPEPVVVLPPGNLRAVAGQGQIRLSWTAPPLRDARGRKRALLLHYSLTRSRGGRRKLKSTATDLLDPSLPPRVRYRYSLRAVYENGQQSSEVTAEATTPPDTHLVYRGQVNQDGLLLIWHWEQGSWWVGKLYVRAGERIAGTLTVEQATRNPLQLLGVKRKVTWNTPYRFLGRRQQLVGAKIKKYALIESLRSQQFGMGGIDWGVRLFELSMTSKMK